MTTSTNDLINSPVEQSMTDDAREVLLPHDGRTADGEYTNISVFTGLYINAAIWALNRTRAGLAWGISEQRILKGILYELIPGSTWLSMNETWKLVFEAGTKLLAELDAFTRVPELILLDVAGIRRDGKVSWKEGYVAKYRVPSTGANTITPVTPVIDETERPIWMRAD